MPEKKKKILSIYINILTKIEELIKTIEKNSADDALFMINEILSTMYEDTKYIDISIYEKLKELKDCILLNTKKLFLTKKIDNEKQIKERTEFVKMLINERIEDLNNYIKIFSNKS